MMNKKKILEKKKKNYQEVIKKKIIEKNNLIQKNLEEKNNLIREHNLEIIKKQILHNFKSKNDYIFEGDSIKNTVLLIEPRFKKQETIILLANAYNKLGNDWNYVFYCGISFHDEWQKILPNFIEIRPLENDNFEDTRLYSDFCKKKELWDSLYGDFVLTIQLDTWIMNIEPYDISYFINLNKSFIGGNMSYTWCYFHKVGINHHYRNFNGGLSLRKRKDMISIIEIYPPLKTIDQYNNFLDEHEDVYFTNGCILLNLPIGDDENSSYFALHTIYHDKYFGIHQPYEEIKNNINNTYPYLKYLNHDLRL